MTTSDKSALRSPRHLREARELEQYHVSLIREGIQQADAGELIDHSEVERSASELRPGHNERRSPHLN